MQTILGSGGAIGVELTKALNVYTHDIRLVSRNPQKINDTDILFPADLNETHQLDKAIEGSETCYVTIGFDYDIAVWEAKWYAFMQRVIASCIRHKTRLVFFDNVYAIGGNHVNHITETSPVSPVSRKGAVRAKVDQLIIENVEKGNIEAIIARAPDFFGPVKHKSLMMGLIYDSLIQHTPAKWLCNADVIHSSGLTRDLAIGTAMLGNHDNTFNQIWNLPVATEGLTGRQWTELFATALNKPHQIEVLSHDAIAAIGLSDSIIRETHEMLYQYDRDYYFDSTKFNNRFNYTPTSNREAVQFTVESLAVQ
ncbi:NAD-dependent epimerase/dehydratase family protein [Chitinophaga flava]|uniref:NAD-dependent dehydratase n=1 Tax=Chitinophaga flava TaxID=2259036 RepID=A0A365Y098_9BACT|nr:NAD-dependent epimerase/dehydratase family protein [Chitinophaga flava]RBL92036.1 NAD-dependent dehydratase [Chitinophaga flava]